jgi:hypothetical protein
MGKYNEHNIKLSLSVTVFCVVTLCELGPEDVSFISLRNVGINL